MTLQTLGGNHPHRQFTGMERQLDIRKTIFEKPEHLHMQPVVAHRNITIFRADNIDADNQLACPDCRKGGAQSGKDL